MHILVPNPQVEESYREYHKTAFTAAAVHPAEAAQEAERVRAAICSLVGLHPPRPPMTETPNAEGGDGDGGIGEGTEEAVREDKEEVRGKEWRGGHYLQDARLAERCRRNPGFAYLMLSFRCFFSSKDLF